jgi:hypothetical protein
MGWNNGYKGPDLFALLSAVLWQSCPHKVPRELKECPRNATDHQQSALMEKRVGVRFGFREGYLNVLPGNANQGRDDCREHRNNESSATRISE